MLITFSCKAYANITMFGDVGLQMLKMMGQSDNVPGAILAADVATALAQLKAAIDLAEKAPELGDAKDEADDLIEAPVSLGHRAFPLIELLTAAAKEECNVMWEAIGNQHP
ncbi:MULTISPECIES: DUF1840 domain-containing protein [unclassified Agarivorans]|uniref:DUF1840 domain-containing protein n=1 Tax=unclassified Agarivorans TaxID=2636026 RepID=UPI003D7CEE75